MSYKNRTYLALEKKIGGGVKEEMGMATCLRLRLGKCAALNSRSLLHLQTLPVSAARCCSSSSSSPSSSGKPKPDKKKLVDRLSAVIDAVNDSKLPPELRGQRNNVR